jgi:hypothetical protein
MPSIIINPGTGPVAGARERSARRNIGLFIRDLIRGGIDETPALGAKPKIRMDRRRSFDHNGWYGFVDAPMVTTPMVEASADAAWRAHRILEAIEYHTAEAFVIPGTSTRSK